MQLRPHQEKAVEMLRDSLRRGKTRPILAAPCSFGKTITAAYLLSEAAKKGKRGIFICDRIKLVQQALNAFDAEGLDVGVMQGSHERSNYRAPIQIASIQTIARRKHLPEFDFAIVDEAHVHYKATQFAMDRYTAVPFIGLTATPYSKGLGLAYNDLVCPISPTELLEGGYLTPVTYYGGASVDVSEIKGRALKTGGSDYDPIALGKATEDDQTLVGDIIKNWLKHAEGRQTIAFSPSIKHSRDMVDQFNSTGIPAVHIDGYMDDEERQVIYRAHDEGEFLILSCSRLLNVGYDAPKVSCLIDCFPTKSLIAYVQRAGRIMRTAEGKENAIYLDHAGNVARHGFAEDIEPESLDTSEKGFAEKNQVKEKKEKKTHDCPQCYRKFVGMRCACGYTHPIKDRLETDGSELKRLEKVKKIPLSRGDWYGQLALYAHYQGYKRGWAAHQYRTKFGAWPERITPSSCNDISPEVMGFIKHQQIRRANARRRA
jgi:superfamily II DNA or RNA helicase